jgi:hypothetical protein
VDEIVLRAIAKWPDVPAVYGWLALDRRGQWSIKGQRIGNRALTEFIGRNYAADARGRWFFQNGPQRVYVALAYTPIIYRSQPVRSDELALTSHTGAAPIRLTGCWLDDCGSLLLCTELGPGLVHDQDLPQVLDRVRNAHDQPLSDQELGALATGEAENARLHLSLGSMPVGRLRADRVAAHFGFDPDPRPAPGEPEC